MFGKTAAEEKFVKAQVAMRRELEQLILDGALVPVSRIDLEPEAQRSIIVLIRAGGSSKPQIQGKPRKLDAKVFVRLIDFDREGQGLVPFGSALQQQSQIPVREILVRSSLVRSISDLGQRFINFGLLEKNEKRSKSILIRNRSEAPLLYAIKKSGSIASGDLSFGEGRYGIVRPYAKREVEFTFEPTMAGPFFERLTIEDVRDRENNQVLQVKANIRKPSNFFVDTLNLDFGAMLVNEGYLRQRVTITNTSKHARTFVVRYDPAENKFPTFICKVKFEMVDVLGDGRQMSKEAEEQIESLEQKLKIAKRKNRPEKVQKIMQELERLRSGGPLKAKKLDGHDSPNDVEDSGASANGSPATSKKGTLPAVKKTENSIVFALDPQRSTTIAVYLKAESRLITTSITSVSPTISNSTSPAKGSASSVAPSLTSEAGVGKLYGDDSLDADDVDAALSKTLLCNGRIHIHELKNTDSSKRVEFRAVVCPDHHSYTHALSIKPARGDESDAASSGGEYNSMDSVDEESPAPARTGSPSTSSAVDSLGYLGRSLSGSASASNGAVMLEAMVATDLIAIEPAQITASRVEFLNGATFYMNLINNSKHVMRFEIESAEIFADDGCTPVASAANSERLVLDGRRRSITSSTKAKVFEIFHFDEWEGILQPFEARRLYFQAHPEVSGQQSYRIHVSGVLAQDPNPMAKLFKVFTISMNILQPRYLRFPSLGQSAPYEFNAGFAYVEKEKKCVKTIFLEVENVTIDSLYLSVFSNLTTQMLAYLDQALTLPVHNILLSPSAKLVVYICIQPNVPTESMKVEEARLLVGGLKFCASESPLDVVDDSKSSQVILSRETVKIQIHYGRSLISLSDKVIYLGTSTGSPGVVEGAFTVSNRSSKLPLDFEISPSSEIVVDREKGTLEGFDVDLASSKAVIRFKLLYDCPGFHERALVIKNLRNSRQNAVVTLRFFADPCALRISEIEEVQGLPVVHFDNIYVNIVDGHCIMQRNRRSDDSPTYERYVDLENTTNEPYYLIPISDSDTLVRWVPFTSKGPSSSVFALDVAAEDSIVMKEVLAGLAYTVPARGRKVLVQPGEKVRMYISCPQPKDFGNEDLELLQVGRKVLVEGVLAVVALPISADSTLPKACVLRCFRLRSAYGISQCVIEPSGIDLGKVGYIDSWNDVGFNFTIKNLAEIPLIYQLEYPSFIRIEDGLAATKKSSFLLEAAASATARAVLCPRLIENYKAEGRDYQLQLMNIYNPNNQLTLTVSATLTEMELRMQRLIRGELVLPPLPHPPQPIASSIPCDTWFAIENSSKEDLRLEFGVELAPEIAEFVRIEILSRFSNSPMQIVSLAATGVLEVKVRAFAREDSALTANLSSYLMNPSGITFGRLKVARLKDDGSRTEHRMRISEEIPIRGSIVEGATFSISEKTVDFQIPFDSGMQSDSEDEVDVAVAPQEDRLAAMTEQIFITNLSAFFPLRFKVEVEIPAEAPSDCLKVLPLDENGCGTADPASKVHLDLCLDSSGVQSGFEMKVRIIDMNSPSRQAQTVVANVSLGGPMVRSRRPESAMKRTQAKASASESTPVLQAVEAALGTMKCAADNSDLLPDRMEDSATIDLGNAPVPAKASKVEESFLLSLRGAKRLEGVGSGVPRYEIDLGQQDVGGAPIIKKVVLESMSVRAVPYRITTYNSWADKGWLSLSRTEGTIEPVESRGDPHTIACTFFPVSRNSYFAYSVIENLENPADLLFLQFRMEVCLCSIIVQEGKVKVLTLTHLAFIRHRLSESRR
jgi:hypothetical protein